MKAMSQSEIAMMLHVAPGITREFEFKTVVSCIMKPPYMKPYIIDCFGIILTEKESGKTELLVKYYIDNKEVREMRWSCFRASEKIKIQQQL